MVKKIEMRVPSWKRSRMAEGRSGSFFSHARFRSREAGRPRTPEKIHRGPGNWEMRKGLVAPEKEKVAFRCLDLFRFPLAKPSRAIYI